MEILQKFEKIDFSNVEDYVPFINDCYRRASEAKDYFQEQYCMNRGLFRNALLAYGGTVDELEEDVGHSKLSLDAPMGNHASDSEAEENKLSRVDAVMSNIRYDAENIIPQYHRCPGQETAKIDMELYNELVQLSETSDKMKATVAKVLYKSRYVDDMARSLTKEQMDYWETEFDKLDILDQAGKLTDAAIYATWEDCGTPNTRRWKHYTMLKKLHKVITAWKARQEGLNSFEG